MLYEYTFINLLIHYLVKQLKTMNFNEDSWKCTNCM